MRAWASVKLAHVLFEVLTPPFHTEQTAVTRASFFAIISSNFSSKGVLLFEDNFSNFKHAWCQLYAQTSECLRKCLMIFDAAGCPPWHQHYQKGNLNRNSHLGLTSTLAHLTFIYLTSHTSSLTPTHLISTQLTPAHLHISHRRISLLYYFTSTYLYASTSLFSPVLQTLSLLLRNRKLASAEINVRDWSVSRRLCGDTVGTVPFNYFKRNSFIRICCNIDCI